MRTPGAVALRTTGALLIAAASVLVALPAQAEDTAAADPTPADVFVPPVPKRLSPDDIVITRGPEPRQLQLTSRTGAPLSLISATTSDSGKVRVSKSGADFSLPSSWQRRGFGDICWSTRPVTTDRFVLPQPTLPFVGPPGTWRYSNVIVQTARGPVVYNTPLPNEYVTGGDAPLESVIVCVVSAPSPTDRVRLTEDPPPITPVAPVATLDPSSSASPTAQPSASALSSPSATASADVETGTTSSTSATGSPTPEQQAPDSVTICHATSSFDNPYTLLTLNVNALSGHLGHTGPLYPQDGWGDVIPPVEGVTPGLNWPGGQALLENGCAVVEPPPTPWPPIEPPEKPVKPEPPIIVLPPLPIEPPIATATPIPTSSATPTQPLPTVTPNPTVTPTPNPTVTPTPTPSASGTPSATGTPTPEPSGTPATSQTPAPSSSPETSNAPTESPASPTATSTPTSGPVDGGTIRDQLNRYCVSKDEADLPEGLRNSRTTLVLTNGVSTITVVRPYTTLYCKAAPPPATTPDGELADTGQDLRGPVIAGLLLIGLGLLVLPPVTRRR